MRFRAFPNEIVTYFGWEESDFFHRRTTSDLKGRSLINELHDDDPKFLTLQAFLDRAALETYDRQCESEPEAPGKAQPKAESKIVVGRGISRAYKDEAA
jgi:hypothetical protein